MSDLFSLLRRTPHAAAFVSGDRNHPFLRGRVKFYQTRQGALVSAEVWGLPAPSNPCQTPVFGFHIHEGFACTGNEADPFADAKAHYNPGKCLHPHHAGDLPPLFGNNGYALSAFLTNRFSVNEIIGRTVIIHAMPDDFTTQPSGDSGMKIACGIIVRYSQGR